MYKVGITGYFSAIHSLAGDVPEEEKLPHAHDYKLEWTLNVENLDERGFSLDISVLEEIRDDIFQILDGENLNENEFFKDIPVSLENLCNFTYMKFFNELSGRVGSDDLSRTSSMEVRIWENDQAWAGIHNLIEQRG